MFRIPLFLAAVVAALAASCANPAGTLPPRAPAVTAEAPAPDRAFSQALTTYEAEAGTTNAAVVGPDRTYHTLASEASGRKAVTLSAAGHYVQWTASAAANALNLRYSLPDAAGGGGTSATLSLYVNGTKVQTLALSSQYAWVYGDSVANPVWYSNSPSAGSPHRFFDQTRFLLSSSIPAGATVKLQKDSGDTASSYSVDFIDLENVGAALAQPAGSYSITSYGAVANDAGDDTAALNAAINAAPAGGTVWIPAGTFVLGSRPAALPKNITLQGAGMWRSVLSGIGVSFTPNAKTVKVYDLALQGATTLRDDSQLQAGFDAGGNGFGSGSVLQRVWFSHLKVGVWTGPLTSGLTIDSCRIFDTYADGINLYNGTSGSTISNNLVRNTGDDGIAIWSGGGNPCNNNTVRDNLVQFPNHANSIAVYGGSGNQVLNNTVTDTVQYGSGIYLASRFGSQPFGGTTTVSGNTLDRAGSFDPDYGFGDGALRLEANESNLASTFILSSNTINAPNYAGVQFVGNGSITGVSFTGLTVTSPGTYGVETRPNARGSAALSGSYGTLNNAAGANFVFTASGGTPIVPYLQVNAGAWQQTASVTIVPGASVTFGPQPATGGSWSWTGGGTSGTSRTQTITPASSVTATASYNDGSGVITTQVFTVTVQAPQPDLVVTALTWSPASPTAGQAVTFSATIKNQGAGATPAGVIHGVAFQIGGTSVTWSDTRTASLAAGASVTLTANGGTAGATWAAVAGTTTVTAYVDDVNRIAETNEGNNTLAANLTVTSGGGGGGTFPVAGTWYKVLNKNSGLALEIGGQTTNDGAGADQWAYLGQTNQKWQFTATDSGYYKVTVQNSSKALDVDAGSTADGAKVQQWTYGGGTNQQWAVTDLGGGVYKITARHDGKALGVVGAGTGNGNLVSQYTYTGATSQQWLITAAN